MKTLTKYILSSFGGKVISKEELEGACKKFKADPEVTVNFMIHYGYLVRILRGLYYVKTLEEFGLKKTVDIYKVLSLGMEKLGVNWYFGLYTGLRLNGLTHEYSDTIFILNDRIFRPKEIRVGGEKVKFIKLKGEVFGFGTVEKDLSKYSDVEKTLLDFVYVSKYRSVLEDRIISIIDEYKDKSVPEKIKKYLKSYPKTVGKVAKDAGLI